MFLPDCFFVRFAPARSVESNTSDEIESFLSPFDI
jgi:hypothetical protein